MYVIKDDEIGGRDVTCGREEELMRDIGGEI